MKPSTFFAWNVVTHHSFGFNPSFHERHWTSVLTRFFKTCFIEINYPTFGPSARNISRAIEWIYNRSIVNTCWILLSEQFMCFIFAYIEIPTFLCPNETQSSVFF